MEPGVRVDNSYLMRYGCVYTKRDLNAALNQVGCLNENCQFFLKSDKASKFIYFSKGQEMIEHETICSNCEETISANDMLSETILDAYLCENDRISLQEGIDEKTLELNSFEMYHKSEFQDKIMRFGILKNYIHLSVSAGARLGGYNKCRRFKEAILTKKRYDDPININFNYGGRHTIEIYRLMDEMSEFYATGHTIKKMSKIAKHLLNHAIDILHYGNQINDAIDLMFFTGDAMDFLFCLNFPLPLAIWFPHKRSQEFIIGHKKFLKKNLELLSDKMPQQQIEHYTAQLALIDFVEKGAVNLKDHQLSFNLGFNEGAGIKYIANTREQALQDLNTIFGYKRLLLEKGAETHWNIFHKFFDNPLLMLVYLWVKNDLIFLDKDIPDDMRSFVAPLWEMGDIPAPPG